MFICASTIYNFVYRFHDEFRSDFFDDIHTAVILIYSRDSADVGEIEGRNQTAQSMKMRNDYHVLRFLRVCGREKSAQHAVAARAKALSVRRAETGRVFDHCFILFGEGDFDLVKTFAVPITGVQLRETGIGDNGDTISGNNFSCSCGLLTAAVYNNRDFFAGKVSAQSFALRQTVFVKL